MGLGQIAESTVLIRIVTAGERKAEKLKKALEGTRKVTDQLDRELKSAFSTRNLTGINKAVTALDKFELEAKQANKALEKLQRTSSKIKPVDASVKRGGGGNAAAAAGSGLLGSALLGGGVAKVSKAAQELKQITADTAPIQEKLTANLEKQATQTERINELNTQRNVLEGQVLRNSKLSTKERDQLRAKLTGVKQELRSLNASNKALVPIAAKYTDEIEKAEKEITKLNNKLSRTAKIQNGIRKTGNFLGGKGSALRSAVLGAGAGLATRSAFGAASQKESIGVRVEILQKEFKQLEGIQESAARSAEKFILSETEVLQSYIDLGNRLGESGASIADLENIYDGLNTVLVKNRASTQEAASATLQLNQALGSGKLQGEEFRAINEAAPQVISEVAKVLGVARGEVKQLAADGLVSSKVLIQALTNIKTKGASQLAEGFTGAFGATRRYDKAVRELSEAIGEKLLPAITPLIEGLTNLINGFVQLDPNLQTAIVGATALGLALLIAAPAIVAVGKGIFALAGFLGALKLGAAAAGVSKLTLAMAGLKVAMLALPWVALAAGVAAATVAVVNNINKQRELDELLQGNSNDLKAYNDAIYNHRGELAKAEKKLDEMIESGYYHSEAIREQKKEIERLREELERLVAQDYQVNVRINYENLLNAKDVMAENFSMDKVNAILKNSQSSSPKPTKTKGGGGGGGGAKPRESQVPALEREVALKKQLNALDKQILEAQLLENSALVESLSLNRLEAEFQGKKAEILAETIPQREKELKIESAKLDTVQQSDQILADQRGRLQNEAKAREEALRPLQQQRELLDAQLAGRGEEQQILQQIETIMREQPDLERSRVEELVRGNAAREEQLEQLRKQQEMWRAIESTIANGITNAILGVVQGTKTLQESLAEVLNSIARILISSAVNTAVGSVFTDLGLTGRASGGPVTGNTPYIVGEKGPELMIPSSSGRVIPNDDFDAARAAMGGGAGGGSADSAFSATSDSVTATRERLIQNEMQATAAKYTSDPITFETIQIGSMDVVTREEAEAIGQASAQQARAQVFGDLRNKPAARRQVGLR